MLELDAELLYSLDVEGFVVIRNLLTAAELLSIAPDELPHHPAVQQYVAHVFDSGACNIPGVWNVGNDQSSSPDAFAAAVQLDNGPSEVTPTADGVADFSAPAHQVDGARLCLGVTAIVALSDNAPGDSIVVVPSTHKSTLAAPDLRAWDAELASLHSSSTDDLGVTVPVALNPGDLFLSAATLMQSVRGAPRGLYKFEFTPAGAFPSSGPPQPPPLPAGVPTPAWLDELTDEEKAVVAPRTVGLSATDPKVVFSDGTKTWVEERPAYDTPRGNPALQVSCTIPI